MARFDTKKADTKRADTRARMIDSAVRILRERGVAGVTVDAVLADSGAPRGSVYHHFPGGRDELVLTAGRAASDFITRLLSETVSTCDLVSALDAFVAFWKHTLTETGYRAGCPVAALGADSADDAAMLLGLAAETFTTWSQQLAEAIEAAGFTAADARILATTVIATIEGAITLCRAHRSSQPLDDVTGPLRSLLARPPGARGLYLSPVVNRVLGVWIWDLRSTIGSASSPPQGGLDHQVQELDEDADDDERHAVLLTCVPGSSRGVSRLSRPGKQRVPSAR